MTPAPTIVCKHKRDIHVGKSKIHKVANHRKADSVPRNIYKILVCAHWCSSAGDSEERAGRVFHINPPSVWSLEAPELHARLGYDRIRIDTSHEPKPLQAKAVLGGSPCKAWSAVGDIKLHGLIPGLKSQGNTCTADPPIGKMSSPNGLNQLPSRPCLGGM